ncbi:Mu-like prophage major head subunit gpT family protein [Thermogemmatispora carboxidivorans]|uniref:phage major capsid protein n=1 Tax=Thermogemmatispora carboxidivorans TaxID=1382306 RepID=UPI00069B900F|nr:Mu-like prophage major head subunit gpT family protein [Thermogemmatispora carboxidivorans]
MIAEQPFPPDLGDRNCASTESVAGAGSVQPQEHIRIEGFIREEQIFPQDERRDVLVTVIRGGASLNGYYYSEAILQRLATLLDNAHAYVDHARSDGESAARSVRDIVGFYRAPHYVPPTAGEQGRVDATLHILESADWLWRLIREACALGQPGLIGLSIDIYGTWQLRESQDSSRPLREVISISALNSCDIVTRPSAGGSIRRILQDRYPSQEANTPSGAASASPQRGHSMSESISPINTTTHQASTLPSQLSQLASIREQEQATSPTSSLESTLQELRLERARLTLERRLQEVHLPEVVKQHLRHRYEGRIFETAELEEAIAEQRRMLAELAATGLVRDHGYARPEIGEQITEVEKIQAAFDRMFELEIDTSRLGNIRGFTSIREAYARVTGDPSVSGFSERSLLGQIHIGEHAPLTRISEGDTTTASFSYLLGTSMNKRLLKDYQAWPAEWQKFCTIVPIKDFKQQTRVRLGAFGSLSTVAEDSAYTTLSLTDTAATYVPMKRGNLVTISRETIINDDLMAIRQIPTKLAVAAAYTLAEFVYGFLSGNPTIYDGSPLFTAGNPHNNLGNAALSTAAMQAGVTAMREQTNFAGKRIGLRPRYLVVPPELEWTAMIATRSAGIPGSPNNDINPMMGYVTPIVSPQLSSPTQWFLVADPREVDTIEIGFVGGQVNPVLFIQDQPLYGLNFTQDVISYKIRHEYGGAVVDYRGLYRGI